MASEYTSNVGLFDSYLRQPKVFEDIERGSLIFQNAASRCFQVLSVRDTLRGACEAPCLEENHQLGIASPCCGLLCISGRASAVGFWTPQALKTCIAVGMMRHRRV